MKKLILAMVLLLSCLLLTACGGPEATYKKAQSLFAQSKYTEAAEKFESLGSYEDASTLAIYCKACALCESGNFEIGIAELEKLGNYKDCALRITYYTARFWDDGSVGTTKVEWMETAKSIYNKNPLYLDSMNRMAALDKRIEKAKEDLYPQIAALIAEEKYADAENLLSFFGTYGNSQVSASFYTIAEKYLALNDYYAASAAFEKAGNYKNASKWAIYCEARYYEKPATYVTESSMKKAKTLYESIPDFEDSKDRAAALDRKLFVYYVDDVHNFSNGLAAVEKRDKWGYIDTTGTLVIPCQWDDAEDFSEGLAKISSYFGIYPSFIDTTGTVVIPNQGQWLYAGSFSEGLAWVEVDDKYGYIDTTGKLVIPCQWDDAEDFSEGLARVKKDGKYGYIDTTGKIVIPCQWYDAEDFSNGLAWVKKDWKDDSVCIDATGKIVISCQWDMAYEFSEGLAMVKKDGKYGFIDSSGKIVSPCQWDDAYSFCNGLARVKKDGKYGYIDTTGKLVSSCQWDDARLFSEGLAGVKKDGKLGYIDTTGKLVIPYQWDNAYLFSEGLAWVKKNGKWGVIDTNGNIVFGIR